MQTPEKITPCLWIVNNVDEAVELYLSAFKNSKLNSLSRYDEHSAKASGMPKGSAMLAQIELNGSQVQLLNGGPNFEHTPSVSLFAVCDSRDELDSIYNKLSVGGKALMELGAYPFSERYVFFADRFGVHWQLILQPGRQTSRTVHPAIIFGGEKRGMGRHAIDFYRELFKNSQSLMDERYKAGEGGTEGSVKHARLKLDDSELIIMDSGHDMQMPLTGAVSLVIHCKDQNEVNYFWDHIAKKGTEIQCGWIQDQFGVFWQVWPPDIGKYIGGPDVQGAGRAMAAMMQMKKLDLNKLKAAYEGK